MSHQQIIARGAEAIISKNDRFVIKNRISKGYRNPELDKKIIKSRTKSETKILTKASEIINCPKPFFVPELDFSKIKMPFIKGKKLSEHLDKLKNKYEIMEIIGEETAKLHDNDIIHGDLTTSNMILVENSKNNNAKTIKLNQPIKSDNQINNLNSNSELTNSNKEKSFTKNYNFKVFIIDFGLGFHSKRIEDKAVDLHLIKQALEAKHFQNWEKLFQAFIKSYNPKDKTKILEQLKKVEARGRYKH